MLITNRHLGNVGKIFLLISSLAGCNTSAFATDKVGFLVDQRLTAYSEIREALASRASNEERAIQVATLGAMWDRTQHTSVSDAIKNDLRKYAQSGDRGIARAAVFALSRFGGVDELREVLERAKNKGQIDNDEFAGEVARNIRFVATGQQSEYVTLLEKANSKYGIDVLTSELSSSPLLGQFNPDVVASIQNLLDRSEPGFPFAIGEFGHVDAMRYTTWLEARAAINEKLGRGSRDAFVLNILNDPKLDPRKAIGYLSAPESDPFMKAVSRKKLEQVGDRIRVFADSLPQNKIVQEFAQLALARISTSFG